MAMPSAQTEKMIADLQAWHFAGRQSLEHYPDGLPYRSPGTKSEKQRLLLQRWLASSDRGYPGSEFDSLVQRFREADFALGTASMGRVLGVKDKTARDKLVADAIDNRWSLSRIIVELKRRRMTVPKPGQGRTVREVEGMRDAVRRLDEQVPGWLRQLEAIAKGLGEASPLGLHAMKVRDDLRALVQAAHRRKR